MGGWFPGFWLLLLTLVTQSTRSFYFPSGGKTELILSNNFLKIL